MVRIIEDFNFCSQFYSSRILFIYFLVSPRGEAGRRGGAKEEFRGD